MKRIELTLVCLMGLLIFSYGQENKYNLIYGPQYIELKKVNAIIEIPAGYLYLDEKDATQLLKKIGNPYILVDGLITSTDENANWYLYFIFNELGYFKMDDVKDELEEIDIIGEIKKNTEIDNKNRIKEGFAPIETIGLYEKIKLNESEKSLTFVLEASENGGEIIENREVRFGRKGIMVISYVCPKSDYTVIKNACDEILNTFAFSPGYKYSDFNSSVDKFASIGIATFLVGREVTKGGWLLNFVKRLGKVIWVFIIASFVAIGLFFKKIFSRKIKVNQSENGKKELISDEEINNTQ